MTGSWCPFFQQRVLKKSGGLNPSLLAWQKRQVIGGSHILRIIRIPAVDRGNIRMDMAVTRPMSSPGCFVLKIIILIKMAFKGERALEFPF